MRNFNNKFKDKSQRFIIWSVDFSKRLILILTFIHIIICGYAMIAPCFGVVISDVFIEKEIETFMVMVGAYLVKSTLENIFRYNDFSFLKSNGEYYDEFNHSETNDFENICEENNDNNNDDIEGVDSVG